jgi:hypothetical protein
MARDADILIQTVLITLARSTRRVTPFEFPKPSPKKSEAPGSESLNADEAKSRFEAKGHFWRSPERNLAGKDTMKDARPLNVTLDLEGNIQFELLPPANR